MLAVPPRLLLASGLFRYSRMQQLVSAVHLPIVHVHLSVLSMNETPYI